MTRIVSLALLIALPTHALLAATHVELYESGRAALARREYQAAVELLEKAVAAKPNDSNYHYWLGSAYGNLAASAGMFKAPGYARKARAALERSVALDGRNLSPRFALIEYFLIAPAIMGGSEEKAQEHANQIKALDAVEGHRAMGRFYQLRKKDDLARREYVEAVRANPTSAKAHYYLGQFLQAHKDYAGALHEMEYTLKLDAAYMMALFRIGQLASLANNNHARGEEALRKYLAHQPEPDEVAHSRTWYWLGTIYEKTGRKAEAKAAFQQSLKIAPGVKDVSEALKRVS